MAEVGPDSQARRWFDRVAVRASESVIDRSVEHARSVLLPAGTPPQYVSRFNTGAIQRLVGEADSTQSFPHWTVAVIVLGALSAAGDD